VRAGGIGNRISPTVVSKTKGKFTRVNTCGPQSFQMTIDLVQIGMRADLGPKRRFLIPRAVEIVGEDVEPINVL